jgi:hypothetical protein
MKAQMLKSSAPKYLRNGQYARNSSCKADSRIAMAGQFQIDQRQLRPRQALIFSDPIERFTVLAFR